MDAKKQIERRFLDIVRCGVNDFPPGAITDAERPDFLIQAADRTVGVEITRIFSRAVLVFSLAWHGHRACSFPRLMGAATSWLTNRPFTLSQVSRRDRISKCGGHPRWPSCNRSATS